MSRAALTLHAGLVALGGRGLLILGGSGSGKSALALRLMALGAQLVADDRVLVEASAGRLTGRAPQALAGLIEARGIGILRAEALAAHGIDLAVDLGASTAARMPHLREIRILGVEIELILGQGVPSLEAGLVQLLRHGRA